MTEPVIVISGIEGAGKKIGRDGIFKKGKGEWHVLKKERDSVDISEEARRRAAKENQGDDSENKGNETD